MPFDHRRWTSPPHLSIQQMTRQLGPEKLNMSALLVRKEVATSPHIHVTRTHQKTGALVVQLLQRVQPFGRRARRLAFGVGEKEGERSRTPAAHAASQLMQLRQAEFVRTPHDDGVGAREIQAAFDDVRREQYVGLACGKTHHRSIDIGSRHLAVQRDGLQFGHRVLETPRHRRNVLDPRAYNKGLATAPMFAAERRGDGGFMKRFDHSHDRDASDGRGRNDAERPQSCAHFI